MNRCSFIISAEMRKWKKTDPTARPGHGARLTPVQIMRFYLRGQGGVPWVQIMENEFECLVVIRAKGSW